MVTIRDIAKTVAPLKRRIMLMAGRAVLHAVNDALKLQTVQVTALAGEVLDGVERFQNYGVTSHPHPGAEAIVLALAGNRNHGVILAIDDRRYRPTDLAEGEAALYTDEDRDGGAQGKFRIHLKRGRELHLIAGRSSIVMTDDGITIVTPSFDLNEAP